MSRFTFADIFTVLNGLFGLLAIYHLNDGLSVLFLLFAVLCDGLDGFVARRSKEAEEQGIVMDSLSDSVSFVLMPALCIFSLQGYGWLAFLYSISAFVYIWCGFTGSQGSRSMIVTSAHFQASQHLRLLYS